MKLMTTTLKSAPGAHTSITSAAIPDLAATEAIAEAGSRPENCENVPSTRAAGANAKAEQTLLSLSDTLPISEDQTQPGVPAYNSRSAMETDGICLNYDSAIARTRHQKDNAPPLFGPASGMLHYFHTECRTMGLTDPPFRHFTKVGYEGRLTVVSESQVHSFGVQRYLVQFVAGQLSPADSIGFVFSPRLPCTKNIQRIVSIFINQRGRICLRVFSDLYKCPTSIKPLEIGEWIEMAIDLENQTATFCVWPCLMFPYSGQIDCSRGYISRAEFPYGNKIAKQQKQSGAKLDLSVGHLACVVKNEYVTIALGS